MPDSGCRVIKVPHADASYHLYYSGPSDNLGRHAVALALSDRAKAALIAWESISPRLARLKGALFNVSVIAVYAPTLDSEDTVKDEFYDSLQNAFDRIPSSDFVVVAGDFNARTGKGDASS